MVLLKRLPVTRTPNFGGMAGRSTMLGIVDHSGHKPRSRFRLSKRIALRLPVSVLYFTKFGRCLSQYEHRSTLYTLSSMPLSMLSTAFSCSVSMLTLWPTPHSLPFKFETIGLPTIPACAPPYCALPPYLPTAPSHRTLLTYPSTRPSSVYCTVYCTVYCAFPLHLRAAHVHCMCAQLLRGWKCALHLRTAPADCTVPPYCAYLQLLPTVPAYCTCLLDCMPSCCVFPLCLPTVPAYCSCRLCLPTGSVSQAQ